MVDNSKELLKELLTALRDKAADQEFEVIYNTTDLELDITKGSTKKLLPDLLTQLELEIVKETDTRIWLKKKGRVIKAVWI